jgi:hypothetical protein
MRPISRAALACGAAAAMALSLAPGAAFAVRTTGKPAGDVDLCANEDSQAGKAAAEERLKA